jgi:molybdenum cofactor biosynthesis protein B
MSASHHEGLPSGLRFIVIVTSDTISRRIAQCEQFNDESGDTAIKLVSAAGFEVADRVYLPNRLERIRDSVKAAASTGAADVVLISGGTGISGRDQSVEAVAPLLDKELPGFGELFRRLSYDAIGTSAIASRATAGICGRALVFALPGSPDAVRLAMERIILPECQHLLKMARG